MDYFGRKLVSGSLYRRGWGYYGQMGDEEGEEIQERVWECIQEEECYDSMDFVKLFRYHEGQ